MTKIASRIATGIAILGLAAPALATTSTAATPAPKAQVKHRAHRKVAAAEEQKTQQTKVEEKKTPDGTQQKVEKKTEAKHKGHAEKPAPKADATTPAPATPAPAAPAAR